MTALIVKTFRALDIWAVRTFARASDLRQRSCPPPADGLLTSRMNREPWPKQPKSNAMHVTLRKADSRCFSGPDRPDQSLLFRET